MRLLNVILIFMRFCWEENALFKQPPRPWDICGILGYTTISLISIDLREGKEQDLNSPKTQSK